MNMGDTDIQSMTCCIIYPILTDSETDRMRGALTLQVQLSPSCLALGPPRCHDFSLSALWRLRSDS